MSIKFYTIGLLYVISLLGFSRSDNRKYVNDMVNFLENILKFSAQNENLIDVNLLFGVTIISGQLRFLDENNEKYDIGQKIKNISDLCDIIFQIAFRRNTANIISDKTQKVWLSPKLWSFDHPTTHLQNPDTSQLFPNEVGRIAIDTSTFHVEYEFCARYLIEECFISKYCMRLILNNNNGGYILTHQILYLHVFRRLVYHQKSPCLFMKNISTNTLLHFLNDKCYQVYEEIINIEDKLIYDSTLLDWFIEGVVVCGLQNFAEFFKLKYIDYIVDREIFNITSLNRYNKYNKITNSTIHMMSVRMGAVILYLKQFTKNRPIN